MEIPAEIVEVVGLSINGGGSWIRVFLSQPSHRDILRN
jgi:hypothetical protein